MYCICSYILYNLAPKMRKLSNEEAISEGINETIADGDLIRWLARACDDIDFVEDESRGMEIARLRQIRHDVRVVRERFKYV